MFWMKKERAIAFKWLTLGVKERADVSFSCYNKCKDATKHSTPYLK